MTAVDVNPLNLAFENFLIEEFDYKPPAYAATTCSLFETLSVGSMNREALITSIQRANHKIMEVKWKPGPGVQALQSVDPNFMPEAPPTAVHTFCAVGHNDTMYFTDIFENLSQQNYKTVGDAFNDFLRKQYGFEPQVDATCTPLNTVREAKEILSARIAGVRYNRHKAVETGWKYDPTRTYNPVPKATPKPDDDPEPAPRPTALKAAPSQSLNEFAKKEGPLVLAYCQKDPKLSKFFDCDRVRLSVSNYRMEHGSSDPLASLFTEEKVNLASAIDNNLVEIWVRARATTGGVSTKFSNCVEQKFNVGFYEKPYISQIQKIYDASVAACK